MLNQYFAGMEFDYDLQQQQSTRALMMEELNAWQHDNSTGKVKPQKVLSDVRELMPADSVLLSDVGAHKMWIARHYQCHLPNTCLIPNGFCSMGFALPGAIAAAMVYPDKPIVGIAGDAGFLMNVQEMETAKRLNSNIVMMVWEDNAYGLIAWKQWAEFGRHTDLDFGNPEWGALAQAFGWSVHKVSDSADMKKGFQNALDHKGPSLVVVSIDYAENQKLTQKLGKLTCSI